MMKSTIADPLVDVEWPMTQAERLIDTSVAFVEDGRLTFLGMLQAVQGLSGRLSWCRARLSYRSLYVCDNPKEPSFIVLFEDGSALRVCGAVGTNGASGAQVLHEIDFIGVSLMEGGHG